MGERTTDASEPLAAGGGGRDWATDAYVRHRNLLFTVAYEILGSAADAEDVLQETWLRWSGVDLDTVQDQRAYLVRVTTRQALGRLRTLGRRRESYVGPWLPEPLLTAPDVAEDVELADNVSPAMLLVLETLTPTERAVFVLREVFDLGYDEIAEAVDKSAAAVRQIAHRARAHVAARKPREVVSPAETREILEAFRKAVATGELQRLLDLLAPDVVLLTDGGGVVPAALVPITGADDVAEDVVLADSVSMAMLLVLETLTPTERAVFVLRDVFDLAYEEIADAVDKTPAAVRQIAHRAREHVAARRPRGVVSADETRDALAAFQRAADTGDLQGLLDLLAPDVVFLGDGGGVAEAALSPVVGAGRVARLLALGLSRIDAASLHQAQVNGYPALILRVDGEVDTVVAVHVDDGLIRGLYAVRNPAKLAHLERETALRR